MTRAALLLFAVLSATAVGALAGWGVRQASERTLLRPHRVRPPAVEAALRAFEEGRPPPVVPAGDLDPEAKADLAFVAAAAGDEARLLAMAKRHEGTDASARALWALTLRAPDPETGARRRRAFGARYPDAWVLRAGHRWTP